MPIARVTFCFVHSSGNSQDLNDEQAEVRYPAFFIHTGLLRLIWVFCRRQIIDGKSLMLFNSIEFVVFLPIVFLLYWFVFTNRRTQNILIIITSYIFYGWWDWRFLLLITFTSFCSFESGLLIEKYNGKHYLQRIISATNIVINLCILVVFKYYNFFIGNIETLLNSLGWHLDIVTINIILPVGISFYTFQALSYTIDIYHKKIPATHNVVDFFAYICFFPQLVAGPIERATNLLPQFQNGRKFDYAKAVDGCKQMLWGFFKKLVIADNCAIAVNEHWTDYATLPSSSILLLCILFTFQIYCDFSGYSDIAIGCARLFGFSLMQNFNFPYFSRSIPEFWRRWHISLTTWFRDYIYFPLGGSKCKKWKIIRNVFIVWAISGLWHGANWTFVCWGLFHAGVLTIYNLLNINKKHKNIVAYKHILPSAKEILQMSITFILTVLGWIIFRAETMTQAIEIFRSIATNTFFEASLLYGKTYLLFALSMLVIEWFQRNKQHALQFSDKGLFKYAFFRNSIYAILICITIMAYWAHIEDNSQFIYFQF